MSAISGQLFSVIEGGMCCEMRARASWESVPAEQVEDKYVDISHAYAILTEI